ncbi:hypothetical protein Misp01_29210 [Microtetraspora sp. NBRC 13810]|uniref:sensor histidine kinase n=1 Tax=Microtetraspora sp. NBRC 13810 TaxID=3030990 RepID=UPI0024A245CF|nr:HAMP domain-containing sensor histidine kinase [Microtetraspora sp. NBRC 13810]GLW07791.1 hypothetical protein Misp01_29210 [Microtetraspora sp. NBRC 13810]
MSLTHGWSLKRRLTVIAGIVMALLCAVVTSLVLVSVHGLATNYKTDQIVGASLKVVNMTRRNVLPSALPPQDGAIIQVLNADRQVVSATPRAVGEPPMARFEPPGDSVREKRVICGLPMFGGDCAIVVAFRVYMPQGDWIIYAADHDVPWYVGDELFALLISGSILLIALATFGTYRVVGKTLRPVDSISAELAEINATDLGRRVPLPESQDEIHRLGCTVNKTLDRLEAVVEMQRRFASDASHDLRSPITAMRAQVEAALLAPEDADWQAMSHAQLDSLDRLEALVSDLLILARLDAGAPMVKERLDLSHLAATELDQRPRRVQVIRHLQPGVKVNGDRLRLIRLLTNLMDNAERHASSRITVSVRESGRCAVLEVLDDGMGIPPDKREAVFQRFTRLDAARNKDAGGTGLGLPIAREIATGHGGTLTVEDSPRGARFVARIPLSDH